MEVTAILPDGNEWVAHCTVGDRRLITNWKTQPTEAEVIAYHEAALAREAAEAEAERLRAETEAAAAALLQQQYDDWRATQVTPGGSHLVTLVPVVAQVQVHVTDEELRDFATVVEKRVGKMTGQERKALKNMADRVKPKVQHGN